MAYDRGTRYIRVDKLIALLSELSADHEIEVNRVGNLSIYAGPGKWLGWVDLNGETVELVSDAQRSD